MAQSERSGALRHGPCISRRANLLRLRLLEHYAGVGRSRVHQRHGREAERQLLDRARAFPSLLRSTCAPGWPESIRSRMQLAADPIRKLSGTASTRRSSCLCPGSLADLSLWWHAKSTLIGCVRRKSAPTTGRKASCWSSVTGSLTCWSSGLKTHSRRAGVCAADEWARQSTGKPVAQRTQMMPWMQPWSPS